MIRIDDMAGAKGRGHPLVTPSIQMAAPQNAFALMTYLTFGAAWYRAKGTFGFKVTDNEDGELAVPGNVSNTAPFLLSNPREGFRCLHFLVFFISSFRLMYLTRPGSASRSSALDSA